MKAAYMQPLRTPADPPAVALAYTEALLKLTGAVPSHRAVAVLHAQCALETGNMASCWNYGVGNVKAGTEYEGYYTAIRLNERLKQKDGTYAYVWFSPEGEERPKGNVIKTHTVPPGHPQTRMRAFKTLTDGVVDKIKFLLKPHWRPALDIALTGDAACYVREVRARGYFTAPEAPYSRAVVSLAAKLLPVARGVTLEPQGIEEDAQLCEDMAECMRVEIPDWLRARVNVHVATLGVDWDDWREARDASMRDDFNTKDTDPALEEVHTGDTEPPGSA